MQTVLKLNELPARHCPRGVWKEKSPCGSFWFFCCLMAPRVLEIKMGTSTYAGLPASSHHPPARRCLDTGLGVPISLGRWAGRNLGIWGWWRLCLLVRKKDFERPNCGLPWGEVQGGLSSYSAEIKLRANPVSKWWASSFTPLVFAECTSVECEVQQGTVLCLFFTGLNNHASCEETKCWLQQMLENFSFPEEWSWERPVWEGMNVCWVPK